MRQVGFGSFQSRQIPSGDENYGGSNGSRREPDVPTPDAVPNAVLHALPLLCNAGDASIGS
jgi:hypothetical protein